jgi:hypothetical protein
MCAVLQEQGDDQVWKISFFLLSLSMMNEWSCSCCPHGSFLMSNFLYLPCRTVSGVKMKKEYKEFIEENKWAHNRAFIWRLWSFCNSILFPIKLVSQIIYPIFLQNGILYLIHHIADYHAEFPSNFYWFTLSNLLFPSTCMIGGVEPM